MEDGAIVLSLSNLNEDVNDLRGPVEAVEHGGMGTAELMGTHDSAASPTSPTSPTAAQRPSVVSVEMPDSPRSPRSPQFPQTPQSPRPKFGSY
jgi:hypothetical protein